jgi:hypothetical protein
MTGTPMRILRLLTMLVTLLSLPGYGVAALAPARVCDAQIYASPHTSAADECCPQGQQHKSCERASQAAHSSGHQGGCAGCQAGLTGGTGPQTFEAHTALAVWIPVIRTAVPKDSLTRLPSLSPDGLFRPPALI